jgi:hypothetical protein
MRYKHTLAVRPARTVEGSAGQDEFQLADPEDAVSVRGNVHPIEADEIVFWGDHGRDMRKVFCHSWPGDIRCRISWNGDEWDQVAPEQHFDLGARTQHFEVIIRRR